MPTFSLDQFLSFHRVRDFVVPLFSSSTYFQSSLPLLLLLSIPLYTFSSSPNYFITLFSFFLRARAIHSLSFLNSHHFSRAPQSPSTEQAFPLIDVEIVAFHPTFLQLPLTFLFFTLVSFALAHPVFLFFPLDVNIFFFS